MSGVAIGEDNRTRFLLLWDWNDWKEDGAFDSVEFRWRPMNPSQLKKTSNEIIINTHEVPQEQTSSFFPSSLVDFHPLGPPPSVSLCF